MKATRASVLRFTLVCMLAPVTGAPRAMVPCCDAGSVWSDTDAPLAVLTPIPCDPCSDEPGAGGQDARAKHTEHLPADRTPDQHPGQCHDCLASCCLKAPAAPAADPPRAPLVVWTPPVRSDQHPPTPDQGGIFHPPRA